MEEECAKIEMSFGGMSKSFIGELRNHRELRVTLDGFRYSLFLENGRLKIRGFDDDSTGRHNLTIYPEASNVVEIRGTRR
jgi:hypothetical protein